MDRIKTSVLAALLLCQTCAVAQAQEMPRRGMTRDEVRSQFGSPQQIRGPVGDPPISRWVYDDFTVYFEGRYTLHSVRHPREETADQQQEPQQPAQSEIIETDTGETGPANQQQPETASEGAEKKEPAASDTGTETSGEARKDQQQARPDRAPEQPDKKESKAGFRFDPDTGRIIEVDEQGNAVDSPAAREEPSPEKAQESTAEEKTRTDTAPADDADQSQASEEAGEETADQPRETAPDIQPAETDPAMADKADEPAAEPDRDTLKTGSGEEEATGPSESEAESATKPEPKSEPEPEPKPAPEPQQKAESESKTETESGDAQTGDPGGSSGPVRATRPESEKQKDRQDSGGGERNFRFDPSTGRIVPTDE